MSPAPKLPPEEEIWRNRFIMLNLVRIGGTLIVMLGLFLWHADYLREGGAMEIGLPLALVGLVISFLGPRHLSRRWRTPPEQ